MQVQEKKFQILAAICASLLTIAEKATLLQATEVPDPDVTTITRGSTSLSEEPGTFTGGITLWDPGIFAGTPAPPPL